MKVYLTITARAELNEILHAVASDNPTAALAIARAIKTAMLHIGAFPLPLRGLRPPEYT